MSIKAISNFKLSFSYERLLGGLFFLIVVMNNTFGSDARMYVLSKYVMLLFFAVSALYYSFRGNKIILKRSIILPFVFFALESLSILWSFDMNTAIRQWNTQLQLFILFLVVYVISQNQGSILIYMKAIYVSGFTLMAYALYRYGFNGYITLMSSGVRMGDEIANQNTFGLVFANATLIAYFHLILGKKRIHLISIILFIFFALSSGSKKAVLVIVFGLLAITFLFYGWRKNWKFILFAVGLAIVAYYVMNMQIFSTVTTRLLSYFSGNLNVSDRNRMYFFSEGIRIIKDRPLLGYGLRNFSPVTGIGTYSHNNFIEVAASTGIIGLIIYYVPYFVSSYKTAKRVILGDKKTIIIFLLLIINIIFGYGMVQFYSKSTWILLGVVLPYIDNHYQELQNQFII